MSYTLLTSGMTGSAARTALNAVIADFDLSEARRKWLNKKVVCFGDSIWNQATIQPELIRLLGVTYNATEMSAGTGGHKPTAYPGSTIVGFNDLPSVGDNSLYIRADDVDYYSPALILICGGTNDNALSGGASSYTLTDAVYTGASFTNVGWGGSPVPSYVSCFKGMMKKLTEQNPAAKIIFMGRYEYETSKSSEANMAKLIERSAADKYCCQWAGVEYIDALTMGINSYNATTYLSSLAHPNSVGGVLMAHEFAKRASML
jgi:lysophospholipase L1-like esterase